MLNRVDGRNLIMAVYSHTSAEVGVIDLVRNGILAPVNRGRMARIVSIKEATNA